MEDLRGMAEEGKDPWFLAALRCLGTCRSEDGFMSKMHPVKGPCDKHGPWRQIL
jgi:hypothetical protein